MENRGKSLRFKNASTPTDTVLLHSIPLHRPTRRDIEDQCIHVIDILTEIADVPHGFEIPFKERIAHRNARNQSRKGIEKRAAGDVGILCGLVKKYRIVDPG